ncbi:MAG: hypothetical protein KGL39_51175 [Patescibacteria group bacterium]|nr:hypothetical protein [Patescibacteria group bacterium]
MGSDLTTIQSVTDIVRDRIRTEFTSLIPDDVWEAMVSKTVKEFITDTPDRYAGNGSEPSPMRSLIKAELSAVVKDRIKHEIDKLGTVTFDNMGRAVASESIKQLATTYFAELVQAQQNAMIQQVVFSAVQTLKESLNRY